jgi:hypothetical protein
LLGTNENVCPRAKGLEPSALPPAMRCDSTIDAPMLCVTQAGAFTDSVRMNDAAEVETLMRNKRELYLVINPGKPAPKVIQVASTASTPTEILAPFLAAARRGFGGEFEIAVVLPEQRVLSATFGELPLSRSCCYTRLHVDPGAEPLTSRATWGDIARDAARGSSFSVPP